jgi:hypothetical protein
MGYVQWNLALTGAPTSAFLILNLPSGWTIDTAKLASGSGTNSAVLSNAEGVKAGTGYNLQTYNASATTIGIIYQSALTGAQSSVNATTPVAWNNGDIITVNWAGPISGWSSNVQMSSDTDTRVVAFSAFDGASVNATNTTVLLPLGTTDVDTHAARSVSNTYVIPVSGFYRVSGKSTTRFGVSNTAFNHALIVYKNGVAQGGSDYGNADGVNNANLEFFFMIVNHIYRFNAGDVIDLRYFTNYTGVATTYLKEVSIERLSGPSVVAATETVAYSGSRTAGNYSLNNSTVTIVQNSTVIDTHNSMNTGTGVYTIPVSGIYEAIAKATFFTTIQGPVGELRLSMGGVSVSAWYAQDSTNSNYRTITNSNIRRLNAGDQIFVQMFNSNAATVVTDSAVTNALHIKRIGN